MPAPRLASFATPALLVTLATACSLDWAVRPEPADAGTAADATTPPSGADGGADGAAPLDGGADATDCAALVDAVSRARSSARSCTLASGHCTTTVKDACGCDVVVAQPGTTATIDYQNAVAALQASSCNKGCTSSCPSTTPRACLQGPSGVTCSP